MKRVSSARQKGQFLKCAREDELTGADFHGEEVELHNGTSKETLEAADRKMKEAPAEREEKKE